MSRDTIMVAVDHDCYWIGWHALRLVRDHRSSVSNAIHRGDIRRHAGRLTGIAIGLDSPCMRRESEEVCLSAIQDHPMVVKEVVAEYQRRWAMTRSK